MQIKKFKNGNFNLQYESDYDTDDYGKLFTEETKTMRNLICLICNSAEMDFIPPDELDCSYGSTVLYNANTSKYYRIIPKDTEDFFNGKSIKLIGFEDDSYAELFEGTMGA